MMSKQCSSCGGDCGHEKTGHCMYGIIHESDCARHNMPAMPKGDCNCYLSKLTGAEFDAVKAIVAKWDYATEAAIEAYLLGRDTERFFKCGDQNDDGKREPRKLPPPSIQCACAFTEWYGMPIDADMDIQTQVAWENWQIAWNASLDAAASEQVESLTVNEELASTKRMFHAACADLGAINEALGLDPDDGGAEPILDAIEELKAAAQPAQAQAVPEGWKLVPINPTVSMIQSSAQHITNGDEPENQRDRHEVIGRIHAIWTDMLSAAPALPTPSSDALKKQNAELWLPYLVDRADGCKGRYAIARWNPDGYREVWNLYTHKWAAFSDDVLTLEQARELIRAIVIPTQYQGVQAISAQSTQTDEVAELSDEEISDVALKNGIGFWMSAGGASVTGCEPEKFLPFCRSLLSNVKTKDAEDAKRYRWARDKGCNFVWAEIGAGNCRKGLDTAIDSAIEQGKDGAR